MDQTFLYIWFGVMIFLLITVPLARGYRGRKIPEFSDFIAAGFSLGGIIALIRVLLKLISQPELKEILELDGQVALGLGSLFGLYLAIREIAKLF